MEVEVMMKKMKKLISNLIINSDKNIFELLIHLKIKINKVQLL